MKELTGWFLAVGVLSALATHAAEDVQFRVRITKLSPEQPARILWRWGGEGLGGNPKTGEVTAHLPDKPNAPTSGVALDADQTIDITLTETEIPTNRIVERGGTYNYAYLFPGTWSQWRPASTFGHSRGRLYVTFMLQGHETGRDIHDAELEFEFAYDGKSLKRFRVEGPDAPTFGIMVPFYALEEGQPTEAFAEDVGSLAHVIQGKIEALEAESWIGKPTPKRYGMLTDCAGYGAGVGYGIRTADKNTMLEEFEVLRLMGLNGLRSSPAFFNEMIAKREGLGAYFTRVREEHTLGYPIPRVHFADGKKPQRHPGDGCPFHPDNRAGIEAKCRDAAEDFLEHVAPLGVEEAWGLTVDEIGTVFDGAPEGKAHQGCCPYCREAFRDFVKRDGRTLEDFGASSWEDIRSTYGYWAISYWKSLEDLESSIAKARAAMDQAAQNSTAVKIDDLGTDAIDDEDAGVVDLLLEESTGESPRDGSTGEELVTLEKRLEELEWRGRVFTVDEDKQHLRLSPEGWHLLQYYSRRFNCEAAAQLFEPLKNAFAAVNTRKRDALARGETDTGAAAQPWIYSFALRGNTFLMGGHSLGFFDFYRYADNGFMYETSNRDRRVWQWDTYLCDVGRSLSRFMDKRFGIYIKPHRGAPIQRALAAVSRGARVIFWYTYGPEWKKGDTFGGREDNRRDIAWVSRLVAGAEDVTYDGDWAVPAEVAIVRPRTSQFFSGSASWENGKWLYTALMHAHIPMVPLDEGLLRDQDLSPYKVIVICGSDIRRDVAGKLKAWVADGGTLYTCGWGMARDESGRPLDNLYPVFGVRSRGTMDEWGSVPKYGATRLGAVKPLREPAEGAEVTGLAPLSGTFVPAVGREVLDPTEDAEVMATYGDGRAAAIRHRFGDGTAWLIGTYAGVEYAWEAMQEEPFSADKRSWIAEPVLAAGVRPVVDADVPLVEGVLIMNRNTGKQAVILNNWEFHINGKITVTVRGAGPVETTKSLALDQSLPMHQDGGSVSIVLPKLDEGDILLLE